MIENREERVSDLRQKLFTYLYKMHPNDPNVALWYGLVNTNSDILEKSLSSGADPRLTDTDVIWSLRDTVLQSDMSDTFIEWLRINAKDRDKRLADLRQKLFTYLYKMHPNDHDVACWYGTVNNNPNILEKSLSSGADPRLTDTDVIWSLRDTVLQSDMSDTFIGWFLEMSSQERPRFAPLFRAFHMALESPFCTLLPKIGDELIKEADPETAKNIHFAIGTVLLERNVGDPADNMAQLQRCCHKRPPATLI